jgi:hypothetical protein
MELGNLLLKVSQLAIQAGRNITIHVTTRSGGIQLALKID